MTRAAVASFIASATLALAATACSSPGASDDPEDASFLHGDKADALGGVDEESNLGVAMLRVANGASAETLRGLGLGDDTVSALVAARRARVVTTFAELDAVPHTGAAFIEALRDYSKTHLDVVGAPYRNSVVIYGVRDGSHVATAAVLAANWPERGELRRKTGLPRDVIEAIEACAPTTLHALYGCATDDGREVERADVDTLVAFYTGEVGLPRCGDGVIQPLVERCDDGNTDDGDGCSATCMPEGDALLAGPYLGDDTALFGLARSGDAALERGARQRWQFAVTRPETLRLRAWRCTRAPSGDAEVPSGCAPMAEGDAQIYVYRTQAWTKLDTQDGRGRFDAAPGEYQLEVHGQRTGGLYYQLRLEAEALSPTCGNDTREAGEECDDGNTADGDGCSAVCADEPYTDRGDDATTSINGRYRLYPLRSTSGGRELGLNVDRAMRFQLTFERSACLAGATGPITVYAPGNTLVQLAQTTTCGEPLEVALPGAGIYRITVYPLHGDGVLSVRAL